VTLNSCDKRPRKEVQAQVPQVREQQDPARLCAHAVVSAIVWHLQPFVRSLQLVIQWIRLTGHAVETRDPQSLVFHVPGSKPGMVRAISGKFFERLHSFGELRFGYE
jgi:hypothetical protein